MSVPNTYINFMQPVNMVFTEGVVTVVSQTVSETDFVFQTKHIIIRSYSKLFRASKTAF